MKNKNNKPTGGGKSPGEKKEENTMKNLYTLETMEHITELELEKIKNDIASDCSGLHTKHYHTMLTGQIMMMLRYGFITYEEYAELKAAMVEKEEK